MGWWIALGIIILLGILPIGICVRYNEDGPLIKVIIGFIKLKVYPRNPGKPKKEKKPKEQAEENNEKAEGEKEPKPEEA